MGTFHPPGKLFFSNSENGWVGARAEKGEGCKPSKCKALRWFESNPAQYPLQ